MKELHIQLALEDGDERFPAMDELDIRYQLEDAIEDRGIGEVMDAGSGLGVMDVYIAVADANTAQNQIQTLLHDLNLASMAQINTVESED